MTRGLKAGIPQEISSKNERAELEIGLVQVSIFYPYKTTEPQQTLFRSRGYDEPNPPKIKFRVREYPSNTTRLELNGHCEFHPADFEIKTRDKQLANAITELNEILRDRKSKVRIAFFLSENDTRNLLNLLLKYPSFCLDTIRKIRWFLPK